MEYLVRMTGFFSKLSYSNLSLARTVHQRDELVRSLQASEAALREEKVLLSKSQAIAHVGSWKLDLSTNHLTWSDEVYRIFGCRPQEFAATYEAFLDFVHPDDRTAVNEAYSGSLREGADSYEIEHRIVQLGTGDIRWVHERCVHERDDAGKIVRSVGMVHDITKRKQAEEELKKSEQKFRALHQSMMDAFVSVDMEGKIIDFNDAYLNMLGYLPDEIRRLTYRDITPGKWHAFEADIVEKQVLPEGYSAIYEKEYRRKDGSVFPVELRTVLMRNPDGSPASMWAIVRDITNRRRSEEALQLERDLMQSVINGAGNSHLVYLDRDFNFVMVNETYAATCGYRPEEMIGKNHFVLYPHEENEAIFRHVRDTGEPFSTRDKPFDYPDQPGRGTTYWDWTLTPVKDREGWVSGLIFSLFETTERKRAEEALRMANHKLNLLSSITRHDINNKLTVIKSYLALLKKDHADPATADKYGKITTAAQQISAMIWFTKEYENIGVNAPVWQDCRQLIEAAAGQVAERQVQVRNDIPAGTEIFADPLIAKVFYNLLDNAVRHGGKITTVRFFEENAGGGPVIVCEDDGDGVPADEKEKIFERGFGKNTGLGLFLTREILAITGITITETGEPGKGARFEIAVPKGGYRFTGEP
jgi:PAS domain S-box-containing protein